MDVKIEESWKEALIDEFEKEYFQELADFVRLAYQTTNVYPPPKLVFNAFNLCPFEKVKVVIVGQDPYHTPGQAMGLAFSVPKKARLQPSLQNIYKEMYSDLKIEDRPIPTSGDLSYLAKQGVLLLNATLSVQARKPGSHQGKGWEQFTDAVIDVLSNRKEHLVFLLWGNYAKQKGSRIDRTKHLVLESSHPSPYSAQYGFFGSKPFSKTNEYLIEHGIEPVRWLEGGV